MGALLWAFALGYWDVFHRRVPNLLVFGAAALSLVSLAVTGSSPLGAGGWSMLGASGLALLLTLPGYLTNKLGAGDVKLLLAVALFGGVTVTLITFVIGALVTVGVAGAFLMLGGRYGLQSATGKYLPFGAALALGFGVALVCKQAGGLPWLL